MTRWLLMGLVAWAGCRDHELAGQLPDLIFGEKGMGPGQFVYPRSLAIAPDGCVFVVDKTARIQRFSPEGQIEQVWRMPEWEAGKPTGLSVDPLGRVLVADTHYHRVLVFDRDGRELARFGSQGRAPGQFIFPTHVVGDGEGNLYVGEYGGNDRITRFAPDLRPVACFGGPGEGEASLLRPQSMALDPDGMLWVADSGHHRICRFSPEGRLLSAFGEAGAGRGQLNYPYDLALAPDGTLVVCEFGNNRVQRFDRQGRSLDVWAAPGRRPGQLAYPWAVAIDRRGRLHVLDSGNDRVQVVRTN